MEEKGIAETIVQSILACPKERQHTLANNMILTGGNAKFPGFKERIETDVRALSPCTWNIKVYKPDEYVFLL